MASRTALGLPLAADAVIKPRETGDGSQNTELFLGALQCFAVSQVFIEKPALQLFTLFRGQIVPRRIRVCRHSTISEKSRFWTAIKNFFPTDKTGRFSAVRRLNRVGNQKLRTVSLVFSTCPHHRVTLVGAQGWHGAGPLRDRQAFHQSTGTNRSKFWAARQPRLTQNSEEMHPALGIAQVFLAYRGLTPYNYFQPKA